MGSVRRRRAGSVPAGGGPVGQVAQGSRSAFELVGVEEPAATEEVVDGLEQLSDADAQRVGVGLHGVRIARNATSIAPRYSSICFSVCCSRGVSLLTAASSCANSRRSRTTGMPPTAMAAVS